MAYKAFEIADVGTIHIYKRKTNRSLKLTVTADGLVRVTMPLWAPYRAGVAFAMSRRSWIASHSQKHSPELLTNGLRIGKSHRLIFIPDSYVESQARAVVLLANGSYGVIYRSVRNKGGHCIACFGAVFAALVLTLYWAKLRFALFLVPAAEAQPAQRI